jgi:hypothetical protein
MDKIVAQLRNYIDLVYEELHFNNSVCVTFGFDKRIEQSCNFTQLLSSYQCSSYALFKTRLLMKYEMT